MTLTVNPTLIQEPTPNLTSLPTFFSPIHLTASLQELLAHGVSNLISSLFSCFPNSATLLLPLLPPYRAPLQSR